MSHRLHVCGFCGSGEYNCPCRDRDELRRMIGVALIVLGLCGALAFSARGQSSGVLGARPEERQAPVWTTLAANQPNPNVQKAAGDGRAKDAKPKASPSVLLARVCANESTRVLRPLHDGGTDGAPDADCLHILETARGWARWQGVSVERAIRALAPHVTGSRPAKSARHAAYAALPARGSEKPAAWDEAAMGPWRVHGPRWVKLRAAVAELVRHPSPQRAMVAWGNDGDTAIALKRGLVMVACSGCSNRFWALPAHRAIDARVASGGRRP